ncbi:50S ribosomal protein L9 [Rickettsia endosymbiont of Cardiosporidium cionae]|uniref:50S ribosomal protein L9 n=1 Tax=Rickettsia endosymbiont of Cardiosporidium cionae TaxID=2777155 RepID=UPI001894B7EF|nr:50S ribosomal protein L9 [Rickettsia endosymbiont of Cardiosporidium cionae]KAF8818827.1 50S ribosomal protein L9 [Rickettsia endosymbiont of Cardiosporidium cionae]
MEIILKKNLRKLGQLGSVVNVKRGYAINYLIPQNFAILSTEKNKKIFLEEKESLEQEQFKIENNAKKLFDKISKIHLKFIVKASSDGKLFGSISSVNITKKLSESLELDKSFSKNILLDKAIKNVGIHNVKISLYSEMLTTLLIIVATSDKEAEVMLSKYLDKNNPATTDQNPATCS